MSEPERREVLSYSNQKTLAEIAPLKEMSPRLEVRVPATSANLGVGFDVMGLALNLETRFVFVPAQKTRICGCLPDYCGEDNLVWTSYLTACEMLSVDPRQLIIGIDSALPLSGGLGASSTCVVAGVVAAQLLSGRAFDRALTLDMATAIEGHPDNVAPAVYGGLTSSFVEAQTTCAAVMPVGENLRFVAMAPPYEVRTDEARKALPTQVPLQTAVWQMGRCVAMANALERGDAALIAKTCHDKLHEPHRMKLIRDYDLLRTRSLQAGACAFVISGSGSTMLAITDGDEAARRVREAVDGLVEGLWIRTLRAQSEGVV
ncbi:MAG: homoserine kinase, partial [Coriobacteriales bacterium]|nr:homoserine kinase [Coriobacteriales bacterium]